MKVYKGLLLVFLMALKGIPVFAQDAPGVAELVKQGMALNNEKNYTAAIEKYNAALKLDPQNASANYQMAFSFYANGKVGAGIPYLQTAIKNSTNAKFTAAAYSLMGSIYGSTNQPQKAIDAYKSGITADSTNQRIYYNLGIACFKNKQYNDAQLSFTNAVKRDATDAGSVRMYALAAFHQNKRAEAVLGFCRYLMIEPAGPQSAEAFGNLQNILDGGALKPEPGYKPSAAIKLTADEQNKLLTKTLAGFATRRYASATELLAAQLKAVFTALGTKPGAKYTFATYFYMLAQTEHMPAFARVIRQKTYPENPRWLKDNTDKQAALQSWMKETEVTF